MTWKKAYFQHHLRATGTILKDQLNCRLTSTFWHCPIERVREYLLYKVLKKFPNDPLVGVVIALTLGLTTYISQAQWQVFRQTGTSHLIAISGLHIGLVASLIAKIISLTWGRVPNGPLLIPTPYVGAFAGLLVAGGYSILAGLSPSTQRAFIMIFSLIMAALLRRRMTTYQSMIFALGVILLLDPFAVLSAGFWLSFIAVFLLIYGMNGRLLQASLWWKWGRAQWVVSVGMIPTLIFLFQQISFLSVPANLLAIPCVSFLVVPSCLLGLFVFIIWDKAGILILKFSIYQLHLVWWCLERMTHFPSLIWHQAFNNESSLWLTHLASYISLLPGGLSHRLVALIYWLPCFVPIPSTLPRNIMQIVIFDVGQGLATLVRTQNHVMIFDTGAKVNENFDMGKMVIVPYLLQTGIKKIDVLTVSHGDNDHIGGAQAILQSLPVNQIITSVPERFRSNADKKQGTKKIELCIENQNWQWDGVQFKFLSPFKNSGLMGNNVSCVLKISGGKHSILMTGDIEKEAEEQLLKRHVKDLPSTILIVPHHGSRTSSSNSFLSIVSPSYAIFSYGYLNSYRHPHQEVISRYKKNRVRLLNTVNSGAITMTLSSDSDKVMVEEYRKTHQRIWQQ